jgi:hypothetical protein
MKRKRVPPDYNEENIAEHIPRDVYHQLVQVMKPRCVISLKCQSSSHDDYDPFEDSSEESFKDETFREYVLKVGMKDMFCSNFKFAVEISDPDDINRKYDVMFMYGEDLCDEYSYDVIVGFTFKEIRQLKDTLRTQIPDLPPFLYTQHDELEFHHTNSNSVYKIDSFDSRSLKKFKKQYNSLLEWILNKS